jgi:hypothetical protein
LLLLLPEIEVDLESEATEVAVSESVLSSNPSMVISLIIFLKIEE